MLADSINDIMSCVDYCKACIIESLEPTEDNQGIMSVSFVLPKSMLSADLNLNTIQYSHSMQIDTICEYIETHDLDDILQFLESISETGNIRYKDIKVSALDSVVSSVKRALSLDINFEEE